MKSKLNAEVENILSLGNKFLNEDLIQCLIYLISEFHSFHHGNKSNTRICYCTNAIESNIYQSVQNNMCN